MITAFELRTGGTAASALPALRPAPLGPSAPNQSPFSPGPMAVPAPRVTEDTRGRRLLHIPIYTLPLPPPPSPLPAALRAGKARPRCRPPGSRGARPEGGGGWEAVPGLPRWSGLGTGERRGRRGEGRDGESLCFTTVFLRLFSETGRGWRSRWPGGVHPRRGEPEGAEIGPRNKR